MEREDSPLGGKSDDGVQALSNLSYDPKPSKPSRSEYKPSITKRQHTRRMYQPVFYPFSITTNELIENSKSPWTEWREWCNSSGDVCQRFVALRDLFAAYLKTVCVDEEDISAYDHLCTTPVDAFLSRWEKTKLKTYGERCKDMNGIDRPEFNHRGEEFTISSFSVKLSTMVDKLVKRQGTCARYSDELRDFLRDNVSECQRLGHHRQRNSLSGIFYLLFQCFDRDMDTGLMALTYAVLNVQGIPLVRAIYCYEVSRFVLAVYTAPPITDHGHTSAHMCVMSGDVPAMFLDFECAHFWTEDGWGLLPTESALLNLIVSPILDHAMVFIMACFHSGLLTCLLTPPDWDDDLKGRVAIIQQACKNIMKSGRINVTANMYARFSSFGSNETVLPPKHSNILFDEALVTVLPEFKRLWKDRFNIHDPSSFWTVLSGPQIEKIRVIREYNKAHCLPQAGEMVRRVHSVFLRSQIPSRIENTVRPRHFTYVYADSPRYAQFSAMSGAFAEHFKYVSVTTPDVFTTPAALYSFLIYTNQKNGRNLLETVTQMEDGIKSFAGNRVRHTKRSHSDNGEVFCTGERKRKLYNTRLERLGDE